MKKIFLLVTFFVEFLSAQNRSYDSLILGSWRQADYKFTDEDMQQGKGFAAITTYYKDSVYQLRYYSNVSDSAYLVYVQAGKWRMIENNSKIFHYFNHMISNTASNIMRAENDLGYDHIIQSLNDSSLVILIKQRKKDLLSYYKREKMLPELEDNYKEEPIVLYSESDLMENHKLNIDMTLGFRDKYYFVNTLDSSLKKRIKMKNSKLEIEFEELLTDSLVTSKTVTTEGDLEGMRGYQLQFKTNSEKIVTQLKKGYTSTMDNSYGDYEYDNLGNYTKNTSKIGRIDLHKINRITYVRDYDGWKALGGAICFFSGITTLFVAPLVSINFKTGVFNSKRYYKWAGAGLIGIPVGICFFIPHKNKTYKISQDRKKVAKDYWYLMADDF